MIPFKKQSAFLAFIFLFSWVKLHAHVTVYIFFSETCPICQSNTVQLNELYKTYHPKGVEFLGVFPNTDMSTQGSLEKFGKKYNLNFPLKIDQDQQLVKQFSATVTPQVFVVNDSKEVLYNGRIDNGFERIGKRRQVITEHYLQNALEDILAHREVSLKETSPVGCFINKK